jgi:hypothetical protein
MEDRTYQKVIAIIIVAAIFGIAIYGSYLPMRKAQMFIATLQGLQTSAGQATSLQDLENKLSVPLNYPSPIGQEELVRNMANSVLSFIQQGSDASSTAALIGYLNSYYDPILDQGKGMSFGQDLYLEGAINEIAFASTGDPTYLAAAEHWYQEGQTLGPTSIVPRATRRIRSPSATRFWPTGRATRRSSRRWRSSCKRPRQRPRW